MRLPRSIAHSWLTSNGTADDPLPTKFNAGSGERFNAAVAKVEAGGRRIRAMSWVPGEGWLVETVEFKPRNRAFSSPQLASHPEPPPTTP